MPIVNSTIKNLKNKNTRISGVGKRFGTRHDDKCVDSGAFVYGLHQVKKILKIFRKTMSKKLKYLLVMQPMKNLVESYLNIFKKI